MATLIRADQSYEIPDRLAGQGLEPGLDQVLLAFVERDA